MTIAELLRLLLPPVAYDRAGPYVGAVIEAEARQIEAAIDSASRVLDAMHPDSGYALDDWERVLGLPEPCTAIVDLERDQRITAVLLKLRGIRGQRPQDYVELAEALGYTDVTVTKFRARRYDRARYGELYGADEWNCVFRVNVPHAQLRWRRYGRAYAGGRYRIFGDAQLECLVNMRRPAHTLALFSYGAPLNP
ncbi:hypothetical protein D3C78_342560 [compost metagenome]